MKVLITGHSGFVGQHLARALANQGQQVFGLDHHGGTQEACFIGDITDANFVSEVISTVQPDQIYHLAGFSSVGKSFAQPELCQQINVNGTRNLLEAISQHSPRTRILIVSSAEVYGDQGADPIPETATTQATSPYSQSRIDQEELVGNFPNLQIIISRSFNHTGVGQPVNFVLPSFAQQIKNIKAGKQEPLIKTGNLAVVRDFSNVKDVISAYQLLLEQGQSGQIYNVGSGQGYQLQDLLKRMLQLEEVEAEIFADPDKLRPVDIPCLIADTSKLKATTKWQPNYSIDRTLADLLE